MRDMGTQTAFQTKVTLQPSSEDDNEGPKPTYNPEFSKSYSHNMNKRRFTLGHGSGPCKFTSRVDEIDDVRYVLKPGEPTTVVKIGPYKGQIYVHFREYEHFTRDSPGVPTKKGICLNYREFYGLVESMPQIRHDVDQMQRRFVYDRFNFYDSNDHSSSSQS